MEQAMETLSTLKKTQEEVRRVFLSNQKLIENYETCIDYYKRKHVGIKYVVFMNLLPNMQLLLLQL